MSTVRFAPTPSTTRKIALATAVAFALLVLFSVVSLDRGWANLLLMSYYLVTLGVGAAVFIALTTVSGAGWNVAFRRVPEAMTGIVPAAGVVVLAVLAVHLPEYTWRAPGHGDPGTFWFKQLWLQPRFFVGRAVACVALWAIFSRLLVINSRRQDSLVLAAPKRINVGLSALFLFLAAITISVAGVDWIMALEPMWFSTMWGVYQFSGLVMATLAAMSLACILLRRQGVLEGIFREDHLHDLGKLLLGFSCFWMYIWFSQYMLIWYSNIPEETSYFVHRMHGPWAPVVVGSIVLNWLVPFFVLLPRGSKRSESVMLKIAVVVLVGRWVDLYVMVFPPVIGDVPVFGVPEVAAIVCIAGTFALMFSRSFAAAAPVAQNDAYLSESLTYSC